MTEENKIIEKEIHSNNDGSFTLYLFEGDKEIDSCWRKDWETALCYYNNYMRETVIFFIKDSAGIIKPIYILDQVDLDNDYNLYSKVLKKLKDKYGQVRSFGIILDYTKIEKSFKNEISDIIKIEMNDDPDPDDGIPY